MDLSPVAKRQYPVRKEGVVKSKESGQAGSHGTIEPLRDLVKQVAAETDPDTVQTLFEQIRTLLRVQLAETERRIKALKNPNRTKAPKSRDRFNYSA
jgi:hypothetical protein